MAERVTEEKLEIPIGDTGVSILIQAIPFGGRCAIIDAGTDSIVGGAAKFGRLTEVILDNVKWRVIGDVYDEDGDPITDVRKAKEWVCNQLTFGDMEDICRAALTHLKMLRGNLPLPSEEEEMTQEAQTDGSDESGTNDE